MDDLTNWPKKSDGYKVVQMVVDGELCVRFQADDEDTHSDIVKTLCKMLRRNYPATKNTKIFTTDDLRDPDIKSEWYEVYEAGKAKISVEEKEASFYGRSVGYGIPISLEHLEKIKPLHPDWKIKAE
jgi:hypothetical protein